jgi:long-chain acyl-CoA synthetase
MRNAYHAESEEQVRAVVDADLDRINNDMPKYKQVHRFTVQTEEMVKTTTGKVKRYQEAH